MPTSLAESAQTPPQGTAFKVTKHPVYFLWGLTSVSKPNVEDVLAGQVGTGGRIANMKIRVRTRFSDMLVTLLTVGIFAPRTVTFEGVVIPGQQGP